MPKSITFKFRTTSQNQTLFLGAHFALVAKFVSESLSLNGADVVGFYALPNTGKTQFLNGIKGGLIISSMMDEPNYIYENAQLKNHPVVLQVIQRQPSLPPGVKTYHDAAMINDKAICWENLILPEEKMQFRFYDSMLAGPYFIEDKTHHRISSIGSWSIIPDRTEKGLDFVEHDQKVPKNLFVSKVFMTKNKDESRNISISLPPKISKSDFVKEIFLSQMEHLRVA